MFELLFLLLAHEEVKVLPEDGHLPYLTVVVENQEQAREARAFAKENADVWDNCHSHVVMKESAIGRRYRATSYPAVFLQEPDGTVVKKCELNQYTAATIASCLRRRRHEPEPEPDLAPIIELDPEPQPLIRPPLKKRGPPTWAWALTLLGAGGFGIGNSWKQSLET